MNEPDAITPALATELARVRRSLRGILVAEALVRLALAALVCAMCAVAADWFLTLGPATRAFLLVALLAGAVVAGWRWLSAPLRLAPGDRDLAELLEQLFPEFSGRLLAAVELSAEPSPETRAVAGRIGAEAAAIAAGLRPARAVRTGVLRAEAAALAAALLLIGGLCATPGGRNLAATGFERLAWPGSSRDWPRNTRIAIAAAPAARVPRGEAVRARFKVDGTVPEAVWLVWRTDSGARSRELCRRVADRIFEGEIPAVPESLSLHAAGGDGQSPVVRVEVVDRPRIDRYAARLVPPAYTGLPAEDSVGPQIRALAGSEVSLTCEANKPLAAGTRLDLIVAGRPPREVPIEIRDRQILAKLTIDTGAVGRFRLLDADGLGSGAPQEFDLRCQPDAAPAVDFIEPTADRKVSPKARVALAVSATDDFGVTEILVRYRRAGAREKESPEGELRLARPEKPARRASARFTWDLGALALAPGDRLTFRAAARDWRGEKVPGVEGRSAELHLEVVSDDEVGESIHRWQLRLGGRLDALCSLQRSARERAGAALAVAAQAEPARKSALESLSRQEEVLRGTAAAQKEFAGLVEEVVANRLTQPALEIRLRLVGDAFRRLLEKTLPGACRELADAGTAAGADDRKARLVAATAQQDDALANLAGISALLREWTDVEMVLARLRRTRDLQEKLNGRTATAAKDLFGRAPEALSAAERSLIAELSADQAGRRDEARLALADLGKLADEIKGSQAQFGQAVLGVLGNARRAEIVEKLDGCATSIGRNQCASAIEPQAAALKALKAAVVGLEAALRPDLATATPGEAAPPADIDTLMTKLEQSIRPLIEDERKILDETRAVDGERPKDKDAKLPRELAIRLAGAAKAQGEVETKTAEIQAGLKDQRTVLFPMVLADALKDMKEAKRLLGETQSGARVQELEENIIAALTDIVSAAAQEIIITEIKHVMEPKFPGAPAAELVFVEDVRMLCLLQAGLNRKTTSFDRERAGAAFDKLAEEARGRLAALGERQSALAGLAEKIRGSANLAMEKIEAEKEARKNNPPPGPPPPDRPDIEKKLTSVARTGMPVVLMREVAKVITEEHESGSIVQKNQKLILEQLNAAVRTLISMVQAVSDLPDQPPSPPGLPGAPDLLKPSPDLTHLTGGPAGEKSDAEKRTDAAKAAAWGQLPPRLREAILQSRSEQLTGRYAELVRLYYRTLAGGQ